MEEDKIRQQARKLINEKYPYLPLKEWGYFEDMFINGWNEALIIQRVSQQRELLSCDCPKCGKEMISEWVKHHHCNKCKEHYTST
jgi:hypothetical protein